MSDLREKRDLYDKDGNLTGETFYKGEPIPENSYFRVVLAFIQNSKGEFLIQKRSAAKDGKYGSTGGHPKAGETSLQGMMTEIKEEIGLTVHPNELQLVYSGRSDEHHAFFDIYYLKKDIPIQEFTLQKEEVDFVEWDSIEKIEQLIRNGLVLENHVEEFYRVLDYLKKE